MVAAQFHNAVLRAALPSPWDRRALSLFVRL
jgi:hypothetical protein